MSEYDDSIPEGLYDPIQDRMEIFPGSDHSSAQSVMATIHEANHAFLNVSTTFGCAMLLCGALVPKLGAPMVQSLTRMLNACRLTHESYATVAGMASAGGGQLRPEMLRNYPAYQQFLDRLQRTFPLNSVFSVVLLGSCARAAMQTEIYKRLLELPCERWTEIRFDDWDIPDHRFRHLMTPAVALAALQKVKQIWRETSTEADFDEAEGDLTKARQTLGPQKSTRLEKLYRGAFDVFAEELQRIGATRPGDEDQRLDIASLSARAQEFAGNEAEVVFHHPANVDEDMVAALMNFRREVLVLRRERDRAYVFEWDGTDQGLFESFVVSASGLSSVQLVAMPVEKLRALYHLIGGADILAGWQDEIVTGLRRKFAGTSGSNVHFLIVTRAQMETVRKLRPELLIVNVLSAVVLYNEAWGEAWVSESDNSIDRSLILVDIDPFQLIESLVGEGGRIHYSFACMRTDEAGQPAAVNVFCFVFEKDGRALYFSPCSAPYRDAIASFIERRKYPVTFNDEFMNDWRTLLSIGVSHVLREESRFGNHFWVTK